MARFSTGRTWGSTEAERAMEFPCDRFLADADDAYYRAIDVNAPAPVVFRWLCQLRVAPYSYDWIDNLGRRSPRKLTPGLEELEVGQHVMTIFDLVAFERERHLTLRLRRHSRWPGDVAVTYLVVPGGEDRCRLVVKLLFGYPGARSLWWLLRPVAPWGELFMMRKQLLTLKRLAEEQRGGDS